ncbi:MAG: hypothetical protein GY801_38760 [bacterium]|nr:hypothetical protein [bacterium]
MLASERNGYWMLFPGIPDRIKTKYAVNGLLLRPFGLFESDLELDFHQKRCPGLVTRILRDCTGDRHGAPPDQTFFWDLTVGKRLECLLAIAMTGGSSELSFEFRCLNEACCEQIEIEISREEIAALQHQSDQTDPVNIQIGSERLLMRKPTGNDQREWAKNSFANEEAAIKAMLRTLLQDDEKAYSDQEQPISDEWVKTINDAMEEFDPLVNFNLMLRCPHCEKEGRYTIDLEARAFHELRKAQLNLLQVIHRLAAHYHWSEQQILSIPPWRRSHYLALIEKEEAR